MYCKLSRLLNDSMFKTLYLAIAFIAAFASTNEMWHTPKHTNETCVFVVKEPVQVSLRTSESLWVEVYF